VVNVQIAGIIMLPAESLAPATITVKVWLPASSSLGSSLTVREAESYVNCEACTTLLEFRNSIVRVAGSIGSLNTALMSTTVDTPAAAFAGECAVRLGGVVSPPCAVGRDG
jgi:hypothetical protein